VLSYFEEGGEQELGERGRSGRIKRGGAGYGVLVCDTAPAPVAAAEAVL
jgi:hypothetical protein